MTAAKPFYTWDYCVMKNIRDHGSATTQYTDHLLIAGYLTPAYGPYERDPKPFQMVTLSDLGFNTIERIEQQWESETRDTAWWTLSTTHGVLCVGIPDCIHPEEAVEDMRRYFGNTFRLSKPRDDDSSPGNPVRLEASWRPWIDGTRAWLDLREEEAATHCMRGAYMRLYGAFDPTLGLCEAIGAFSAGILSDSEQEMALAISQIHLGQ